jgi:chromosome segregation ATPase
VKGLILIAIAILMSGCATVGGSIFSRRLPYEARVYLLDAEEDLMTARARADQADREVYRAKQALGAADKRLDDLRESKLEAEAKAQVKVAQAQVTREERQLELLDAATVCAERRYHAARARAEVKFKVNGADEGEASRLEERAEACTAKLDKKELALAEAEEQLARARAEQDRASQAAAVQAPLEHPRPWIE